MYNISWANILMDLAAIPSYKTGKDAEGTMPDEEIELDSMEDFLKKQEEFKIWL